MSRSAPSFTFEPVIPVLGGAPASTEFRWCLSPELRDEIVAASPKPWSVHLLVVVTNGGDEMSRQLFPIGDGRRHVLFFRPGTNVVHATIVYGDSKNPKDVLTKRDDEGNYTAKLIVKRKTAQLKQIDELIKTKRAVLCETIGATERGRLEAEITSLHEQYVSLESRSTEVGLVESFNTICRTEVQVELEFIVSEHAFGKPNWWITRKLAAISANETKAIDPCHVRKRALAAAPTLVFLAIVALFVFGLLWPFDLLAVAALLLAGMRGIDYSALSKPWKFMPNTI